MINYFYKSLFVVILALMMLPSVTMAAVLVADFEETPLFLNTNVLPGDSESRTVGVTNAGTDSQNVYVSVQNPFSDGLAEIMRLVVTDGSAVYYDGTFSNFFTTSPITLGTLVGGASRTYTFSASIDAGVGNDYQNTTFGFDLIIGFEGGESVTDTGNGPGGVGGGGGGGTEDDDTSSTTRTTDPTPPGKVGGASTGPDPDGNFWSDLIDQINGLAKGIVGGASASNETASTTDELLDSLTSSSTATGTVLGTTEATSWLEAVCDYLWLLVILWLLASAMAYWRDEETRETPIFVMVQIAFGGIAIVLLISYLLFGIPCSLWPALIVTVGAIAGLFLVRDE